MKLELLLLQKLILETQSAIGESRHNLHLKPKKPFHKDAVNRVMAELQKPAFNTQK